MLELRGCMAIALLLFSNNLGAEELYKLLGFDPTAPEFDRAVYDLVETPENIVASVGLASLMLMGEIDDEPEDVRPPAWNVVKLFADMVIRRAKKPPRRKKDGSSSA